MLDSLLLDRFVENIVENVSHYGFMVESLSSQNVQYVGDKHFD